MAIPIHRVSLFLVLCFAAESYSSIPSQPFDHPKTYIIHVSESDKPSAFTSHFWYSSILQSLSTFSPNTTKILYTYERAVHGFSAHLTAAQSAELLRLPGIISVLPDELLDIQTTRTPHFLGLTDSSGLWPNSNYGENIIVGVLDTGIWPELPSFSDKGLSPVPSGWKGKCESGPEFPASSCNRKIIGARAYHAGYQAVNGRLDESKESKSPRDTDGHGTHTASTAAGSVVPNASFFGYEKGVASGVAVKARIAVYKVCWSNGCSQADILAAMDDAIFDGVHVISFSIGARARTKPREYYLDNIAIGSFGAVRHGILFSCAAGNDGPGPYTTRNLAPWMLSVGASTIDREFKADVILGNGTIFAGKSLYSGDPLGESIPLVYGGDSGDSRCLSGKLIPSNVTGKIVICDSGGSSPVEKGIAVNSSGGVGMILANSASRGDGLVAYSYLIPATTVSFSDGNEIKAYVKSVASPTATIVFKGTVIGTSPSSPRVASFSSRGPNNLTAEILKPDVIAPGVDILAGWTGDNSPSKLDTDPRRVEFNIISGTSMACPHVSGLAALLRKTYPKWTPAALKSALMTTAYNEDNSGRSIKDSVDGKTTTPFSDGSGHVDAIRAPDPGLVYDMDDGDYLSFLCAIGYNQSQIAVFLRGSGAVNCSAQSLSSPGDLNYPSFSVVFDSNRKVVKYKRVVTNVGSSPNSIYNVTVSAPTGVEIAVSPTELVFNEESKSLSYQIAFTSVVGLGNSSQAFGSIEWSDGTHRVRSPIAVVWTQVGLVASVQK